MHTLSLSTGLGFGSDILRLALPACRFLGLGFGHETSLHEESDPFRRGHALDGGEDALIRRDMGTACVFSPIIAIRSILDWIDKQARQVLLSLF